MSESCQPYAHLSREDRLPVVLANRRKSAPPSEEQPRHQRRERGGAASKRKKRKTASSPASTPSKRPPPTTPQGPCKKRAQSQSPLLSPALPPPAEDQGLSDSELPVEHEGPNFAVAAGEPLLPPAASDSDKSKAEEVEEEPELYENFNMAGGRYGKTFARPQTPPPGPPLLPSPGPSLLGTTEGRWLEKEELFGLSEVHSQFLEVGTGPRQWLCVAEVEVPRLGAMCGWVNNQNTVLCGRCCRGHQPFDAPKRWRHNREGGDPPSALKHNSDVWHEAFGETFFSDGTVREGEERCWEGDDGFWRQKPFERGLMGANQCWFNLRERAHSSQKKWLDRKRRAEKQELIAILQRKGGVNLFVPPRGKLNSLVKKDAVFPKVWSGFVPKSARRC